MYHGVSNLSVMDTSYAVTRLTTDVPRTFKPKHISLLIAATHDSRHGMSEIFRNLRAPLSSSSWIVIIFNAWEGNADRVLGYLAGNAEMIDVSYFRDRTGHPIGSFQTKNIQAYGRYLEQKVKIYKKDKCDYVSRREQEAAIIQTLENDNELMIKCESLQQLIEAGIKCSWDNEDLEHIVPMQAFRLLLADMMALFQLMNAGMAAILSRYFLMTKPEATRALAIYKKFAIQSKQAVEFFNIGRKMQRELMMDIPAFSHPPLELAASLEKYLNAPDFEQQREAYRIKKGKGGEKQSDKRQEQPKEKPLIDFFDSIDNQVDQFRANEKVQANFNSAWEPGHPDPFNDQANPFATNEIVKRQQQLELQMAETNRLLQNQQRISINNQSVGANVFNPTHSNQFSTMNNPFSTQVDPYLQVSARSGFTSGQSNSSHSMEQHIPVQNSVFNGQNPQNSNYNPFVPMANTQIGSTTTTSSGGMSAHPYNPFSSQVTNPQSVNAVNSFATGSNVGAYRNNGGFVQPSNNMLQSKSNSSTQMGLGLMQTSNNNPFGQTSYSVNQGPAMVDPRQFGQIPAPSANPSVFNQAQNSPFNPFGNSQLPRTTNDQYDDGSFTDLARARSSKAANIRY